MGKKRVAYFCMEYGLRSDVKWYAGGLGILAGDYLKGAADYGYPVLGIGLLWKQGYTDQYIDEKGRVYDSYYNYNYDFLEDTGICVEVEIRKRPVKCKVWKTNTFGNADLYLLDTDLAENEDAWITGQLYGWFGEERVAQEMVLGIGGIRALRALGIDIDVYHFNEGHALFAGFELLRETMDKGFDFADAMELTKQKIVFTTHTPVVQGNESHPIDRLTFMGANLGLTKTQLKKIGGKPFNMTVGALRMARSANAVAQLHGITANEMWKKVSGKAPIHAITNGIHHNTWVDSKMVKNVNNPKALWKRHQKNKKKLIELVWKKNKVRLKKNALLIGFSRRAVAYKRCDFIFSKPEIIDPLLKDNKIQIVFSGRAHPLDDNGKKIVSDLWEKSVQFPDSVVYLENYDMEIGAALTRGADLWLNNPRRPKEASGTSGMKASMNGVLNCSILDGWWPEACQHGINGWQFGDGFENEDDLKLDKHDIKAFYKVLLKEVIPTYYENPKKWVSMMQASIKSTYEPFSVERMLKEYYDILYT